MKLRMMGWLFNLNERSGAIVNAKVKAESIELVHVNVKIRRNVPF